MASLDMRHILNGEHNIAAFALKREATSFAKSYGWRTGDVTLARNRFCEFWVICQGIGTDGEFVFLKRTGETVILPGLVYGGRPVEGARR